MMPAGQCLPVCLSVAGEATVPVQVPPGRRRRRPAGAAAGLAAEWPTGTGKSESKSRPLRLVGSESPLSGPGRLSIGPPGLGGYSPSASGTRPGTLGILGVG
jgi:hypothetical protein